MDINQVNILKQRAVFRLAAKIMKERGITHERALSIAHFKMYNNGREPPTSKK